MVSAGFVSRTGCLLSRTNLRATSPPARLTHPILRLCSLAARLAERGNPGKTPRLLEKTTWRKTPNDRIADRPPTPNLAHFPWRQHFPCFGPGTRATCETVGPQPGGHALYGAAGGFQSVASP